MVFGRLVRWKHRRDLSHRFRSGGDVARRPVGCVACAARGLVPHRFAHHHPRHGRRRANPHRPHAASGRRRGRGVARRRRRGDELRSAIVGGHLERPRMGTQGGTGGGSAVPRRPVARARVPGGRGAGILHLPSDARALLSDGETVAACSVLAAPSYGVRDCERVIVRDRCQHGAQMRLMFIPAIPRPSAERPAGRARRPCAGIPDGRLRAPP